MVDHPFEQRPARVPAVRPFARPLDDGAAAPSRGPSAGRPTPFVSPAVPEPGAPMRGSEDALGGGAVPVGGVPTGADASDSTPAGYSDRQSDLPSLEEPSGERTPYPSWETLMEERGVADRDAFMPTPPAIDDLRPEAPTPAHPAAAVDLSPEQMPDHDWAGSPEDAASERAAAATDVFEHDLDVIDLDEQDVEVSPLEVSASDAGRARKAGGPSEALVEAVDEESHDSPSAETLSVSSWSETDPMPAEAERGAADHPALQGEVEASMLGSDIDLSDDSSDALEHATDHAAPADAERVIGDRAPSGDHAGLVATDGEATAPRESEREEALDLLMLPGSEAISPAGRSPETEAPAGATPAVAAARLGRTEVAAAVLDRLADRLRRGELALPGSFAQTDEILTVAHVLTALLGASRPSSAAELPPPTTGTEL